MIWLSVVIALMAFSGSLLGQGCTPKTLPYTDDFSSGAIDPCCYHSSNVTYTTFGGHSGSSIKMDPTASDMAYIAFPEVNRQSNQIEVTFWLKLTALPAGAPAAKFMVGLLPDPLDITSFEMLYRDSLTNTDHRQITMNTAAALTISPTARICVVAEDGMTRTIRIDDLDIHALPGCIAPGNLTVTDRDSTSVTLDWGLTNATNVKITARNTATSATLTDTATAHPFTFAGLTPNTTYEFAATALCSASDISQPSAPLTTTTLCPVAATPLFAENFDNLTGNNIPACWEMGWINRGQSSKSQPFKVANDPHFSGSKSMMLDNQQTGTISYLTTQCLPIDQAYKYEMSVMIYREQSQKQNEGLQFWISPTPFSTDGGTMIGFVPRSYSMAPVELSSGWYEYVFPIATQGNGYLMVVGISEYDGATYFDDLTVRIAPTCPAPKGIDITSAGSHSAAISWSAGRNETEWVIHSETYDNGMLFKDTTIYVTGTPSCTINGLNAGKAYAISGTIKAICAANDSSEGVFFSKQIVTDCESITSFPYQETFEGNMTNTTPLCWNITGSTAGDAGSAGNIWGIYEYRNNKMIRMQNTVAGNPVGKAIITSPEMSIPAGNSNFEFSFDCYNSSTSGDMFAVVKVNGAYDTLMTIHSSPRGNTDDGSTPGVLTAKKLSLAQYAGQTISVGFHAMANNGYGAMFVDNVSVREHPACADVVGTVSNVKATEATISVNGSTTWEISYGINITSATEGTTIAVNNHGDTVLGNLAPQTTYIYFVRNRCGSQYGDWSSPMTFTTFCGNTIYPFYENFESMTVKTPLGGCYITTTNNPDKVLGTYSNASDIAKYNHTANGTKGLTCLTENAGSYTYASTKDNFSLRSLMHLEAGTSYEISLWAKKDAATFSDYSYRLSFEIGGDTANMTALGSEMISETDWTMKHAFFSVDRDGDYFLGFSTTSREANKFYYIYIDDYQITKIGCMPPTTTTINSAAADSVVIGIGGNGLAWEIAVSDGNENTGNIFRDTVSSPDVTIRGLNPNSQYYYTIRTICNDGASDWMGMQSFRTSCTTAELPYYEDFDMPGSEYCWTKVGETGSMTRNTSIKHNNSLASLKLDGSMVATPEINATGVQSLMLSGWVYTTDEDLTVITGSIDNANDIETFVSIGTFEPAANTWQQFSILVNTSDLSTQNVKHLALMTPTGNTAYFDDIDISEITSCTGPALVTVTSTTSNSATITFTDSVATHTAWEYACGVMGFDPDTATWIATSSKTFTINGLSDNSNYDVYVRTDCGNQSHSNYKKAFINMTNGAVSLPFICNFEELKSIAAWEYFQNGQTNAFTIGGAVKCNGNNGMYISKDGGSTFEYDIRSASVSYATVLLSLKTGRTYEYSYNWQTVGGETEYNGNGDYGHVFLLPSKMTITAGQRVQGLAPNALPRNAICLDRGSELNMTNGWQFQSGTVTVPSDTTYRLVVVWNNDGSVGNQTPLAIDNLIFKEQTCFQITGMTQTDATSNSVTVSYSNPNEGATIHYAVSTSNSINDTIMSGNTVATGILEITGLQPSRSYTVFLRADCSADDHSLWSQVDAATACSVITEFPLTEDFNRETFPPACWTVAPVVGSTSTWVLFEPQESKEYAVSGNAAHLSAPLNGSALLSTPQIHFDANREYHVKFVLCRTSNNEYLDKVDVYVGPTATSTVGATLIGSVTAYDDQYTIRFKELDMDIPANISGNQYVMFKGTYSDFNFIYLDNVSVEQYPVCRDLENVPEIVSTTSATGIVSEPIGNREAILFAWAPYTASTTIADTVGSILSTAGTATITGLTANTNYAVFAQGICADDERSAWTPAAKLTTKANDCFAPDNIHIVGEVNATDATLSWNGAPDATKYTYELSTSGRIISRGTVTSDTIVLTGLTAKTQYNISVRTYCSATDSTVPAQFAFRTIATPATVPYACDFETTSENVNWDYIVSQNINNFVIGNSQNGKKGGSRGLYISNDGITYGQTLYASGTTQYVYNVAYAIRTIDFAQSGTYQVDFDWRCFGTTFAPNYNAIGRAYLAPMDADLQADNPAYIGNSLPAGALVLESTMKEQQNWKHSTNNVMVSKAGRMNLVFCWAVSAYQESGSDVTQFPLAIDNINIVEIGCMPVDNTTLIDLTSSTAKVLIEKHNNNPIEYTLSSGSDTTELDNGYLMDTVELTGLTPATQYTLYVRTVCEDDERSAWKQHNFRTTSIAETVPFVCSFETGETHDWMITSGQTNNFMTGSYASSEGFRSMFVSGDGITNEYVAVPGYATDYAYSYIPVAFNAGTYDITFDWMCEGESTFDYGHAFLAPTSMVPQDGKAMNGMDATSVPIGAISLEGGLGRLNQRGAWNSAHSRITITEPCVMNLVFSWTSNFVNENHPALTIDNIQIRNEAEKRQYADTVCYSETASYSGYGFNISADRIYAGHNTYDRWSYGTPDTLHTLDLYMLPKAENVIYDTITRGMSYTKSPFNLQAPESGHYEHVIPGGASTHCDSIVSLELTVKELTAAIKDTICQGDVYILGDTMLTTPGVYIRNVQNPDGGFTLTTLTLAVEDSVYNMSQTICEGESYTVDGQTFTKAGTYRIPGMGRHNCSQTKILRLTVIKTDSVCNVTFCEGGMVQIADTIIRTSGNYTIVRANGPCTLTYHVNATATPAPEASITDFACEGYPYTGFGLVNVELKNDTAFDIRKKIGTTQCDSITHVTVKIEKTKYNDIYKTILEGESFTWNEQTYTTEGNYTVTLKSTVTNCDSIVTLHLHVSGTAVDNVTAIAGEIAPNPVKAGATAYVYGIEAENIETAEIINGLGQTVERFKPETTPVEVNCPSSDGIYYIRVRMTDGTVWTGKMIVK